MIDIYKTAAIMLLTSLLLLGTSEISKAEYDPAAIPEELIESRIAQDPENHAARIVAGFMHFDTGRFSKAEKHFAKAASITPDDPYDQIWLYMSQLRQNAKAQDGQIRAFVERNKSKEFIYTDITILLGDIPPNKGIEQAELSKDLGNVCEAYYYAAQRLFADGNKKQAEEYLFKAVETEQTSFWEYKSALAYLRQNK